MQCGSRFSVIRCVKTRRLQTTSLSRNEFLPRRNAARYYLAYVTCGCHKLGAILLNCSGAEEFHFPRGTSRPCSAYRSWATIGCDVHGALITLKMRTSSAQAAWQ